MGTDVINVFKSIVNIATIFTKKNRVRSYFFKHLITIQENHIDPGFNFFSFVLTLAGKISNLPSRTIKNHITIDSMKNWVVNIENNETTMEENERYWARF